MNLSTKISPVPSFSKRGTQLVGKGYQQGRDFFSMTADTILRRLRSQNIKTNKSN